MLFRSSSGWSFRVFDLERLFKAQSGNTLWFVAMPRDESLESTIGKAGELEKNYD